MLREALVTSWGEGMMDGWKEYLNIGSFGAFGQIELSTGVYFSVR
jgi:hypothetical protein